MMHNCGVKLMLMMALTSGFTAELLRPPQPPQFNYAFNRFRPQPPTEPTIFQRITNWFWPWGGMSSEEEFHMLAAPKIDQQPQAAHYQPISRINPPQVRDTEPTTARTTRAVTKCNDCNKVPWIPMMPTYQLPVVNSGGQGQVNFKHHFGNENPYAQVPNAGYKYGPPSTTPIPYSTTPIRLQDANFQGHQYYGIPPFKQMNFQGYQYSTPKYAVIPRGTTLRPNTNTIDTSVITFTTQRTENKRPLRFTSPGAAVVTNPEYLPPPQLLPLEGENTNLAPIPIPNLSPTPIAPLFDAQNFLHDPYRSQQTGFIKLVPLEPFAQLSNNVNVKVKPDSALTEFEAIKKNPALEVINSNLVAEFTITGTERTRGPGQALWTPGLPFARFETTTPAAPLKLNLDIGNNLDVKSTLSSPIVVGNDAVGAGSEHSFHRDINQGLGDEFNGEIDDDDEESIESQESNRVVPEIFDDEEQETTTEAARYTVKFEPSLQTAADLAENNRFTIPPKSESQLKKNRDRQTPLELLDSPIFHVTPFTTRPSIATRQPPPFRPIDDYTKKLSTLWTSPVPISTSTEPTPTPTYTATQSTPTITSILTSLPPAPATTLAYLAKLSSGALSGISPPKEPPKPAPSTKKPKQVQIVIPYTSYHKPAPFKNQNEQEIITYRPIRGHYVTHPPRKAVTETTTTTTTTTSRPTSTTSRSTTTTTTPRTTTNFPYKNEIISNIDSFNGHGYHNDQEYPDHAQESKIVESKVTIEPPRSTKYLTKILANNIRDLLKKEKTPKPPRIDIIRLQKNIDGWTEQSFLGKASTISQMGHTKTIPSSYLSSTMSTTTTMMTLPTTTLSPKTTFDPDLMEETKRQYENILYKKEDDLYVKRHDRFLDRDNELVLINNNLTSNHVHEGVRVFAPKTTLTPRELWKRLHLPVTVSPLTNEKVYVVTPQPSSREVTEPMSTFRPRFAVRPTIGKKLSKKLEPEASRRMDDEIDFHELFEGKSEAVRIVTPEPLHKITKQIAATSEQSRT